MRGISTPAIAVARKAGIEFSVQSYEVAGEHGPEGWGVEAARALGLDPARVFKTLIVLLDDGRLAVTIIPVAARLRPKSAAAAFGAREAHLAAAHDAERATGYVLGGISPLGQRRTLSAALHASAFDFPTIHVSAGQRGLQIELSPHDLARLISATTASLTS